MYRKELLLLREVITMNMSMYEERKRRGSMSEERNRI
jgi:hypothetical protein